MPGRPRGRIPSVSARVRGPCPAPTRRRRDPRRPVRCREWRGALPQGAGARKAARNPTARRSLPPWPRQTPSTYRQAAASPGASENCDDDVPRDGHGVLAREGGDGNGGVGMRVVAPLRIVRQPAQGLTTTSALYGNLDEPARSFLSTGSESGP